MSASNTPLTLQFQHPALINWYFFYFCFFCFFFFLLGCLFVFFFFAFFLLAFFSHIVELTRYSKRHRDSELV